MKYIYLMPLALLFSCNEKETVTEKNEKFCLNDDLKKKVTIEEIKREPVSETFTLTGNVTYNSDNVIQFTSLINGVVTNTYFSLGDYVKKGQVLAEIKSTELNGLQSENKSVESQLAVAQRQLASVKSMFEDGIASQKDLIQAESEVKVLKASLENIKSNLALYSASPEKSVFQIKAPSNGFIVAKNMSSGMQISSGSEPLFTISDLNEVWVMVNIYATDMQNIKENMEVKIKTLAYPDEVFSGKISALSQVFDAEEHVLKARIVMKNTDLKLKPGMSADIILNKSNASAESLLAVPVKAVIFDDNQNFLVVYKDDCNLEIRQVDPVTKNREVVYFDKGIQENEKIISKNQLLIYESLK
ncbi:MAG: efflux RND transporter periplasmic adaptor subunit [Flavobacterium lindanitolerans]|jgi:cobalt-zinc-cadmium efflux system membrane fusion protein|uniref:efflux RND transporter periplasmic adaptor subunit n=1 Tax=Flavobacterium TaxID=237 RepID=UPI0006F5D84E|nr:MULTISPECIES: efflux RND transporter periplasmic adaptor subunit [Flavobacterium]MBU7569550.1 efflux RND transporter periplasmic adaptor subunit [Flavobacterium sp.]PZO27934.1 MAG: efflux RND transporter periplasmic adaptor subunit [Flavobacteriaceae bacterium]PZQ84337.1 MAG: efflux RND transporter periplasmic adaptor subunit [Flavobacterium johnsoniae]KQS45745.1 RND transporter [Flavobacterium sp. Leaf359]MBL7868705.1 efflux RND transporter periplasmic adaptor subunit [Flavobacterium linda